MEKIIQSQLADCLKKNTFVMLDFSSPGCAPCKKVPPILAEIIAEAPGIDIAAYEVDIVEQPAIAQQFFVLGVPTIIVCKSEKEIGRFNAIPNKEKIKKLLQ